VNLSSEGAQEPAVCNFDPLDIVAAIREGVLEPDRMVRFANGSFADTFTSTPKDAPRDEEGPQ
jgi:hypothetical protein